MFIPPLDHGGIIPCRMRCGRGYNDVSYYRDQQGEDECINFLFHADTSFLMSMKIKKEQT